MSRLFEKKSPAMIATLLIVQQGQS